MTERYKSFPPKVGYLRIPLSSRGAALAGLSVYPACRPRALWAMRALREAVHVFGPRVLPGPAIDWTPPMEPELWAKLCDCWRSELGEFDTMAVYHREFRAGFALLLIHRGRPVSFLKARRTAVEHLEEIRALEAVSRFGPQAFSAPALRAVGTVNGWAYFAMSPFPTEFYTVPRAPRLHLIVNDIRAALSDLPRPPGTPDSWTPMHGDLTPWNLRQGRDGRLYLFDWERAGWGPPGADEVLYRAASEALGLNDCKPPDAPEAIRYWMESVRGRMDRPDANPLAPSLGRILRGWQSMNTTDSATKRLSVLNLTASSDYGPETAFHGPGGFIVIVGPDGVGKTTVAQVLAASFSGPTAYFHFIPPVWRMSRNPPRSSRPRPKVDENTRGFAPLGWFRLARNFARYWAGYLLSVRPVVRRGGLVIGDRGLYGYVVQPRDLGFFGPARLAAALVRFLPRPDLIVNLSAAPEVIALRKTELTPYQIAGELSTWARLPVRRLRTFASDDTPERIAWRVLEELDRPEAPRAMADVSDPAEVNVSQQPRLRKPDFFLVGAAKAGTTSLFRYLIQHPSIFIPAIKEPHYFSEYPQPHAPVFNSLEEYLALYRGCDEDVLAGDASTSYLYSRQSARRIFDLQPQARIIMVLRNPIERAYSFYWHNRREFAESLTFEEALLAEPARIAEETPFRFHYVNSGRYFEQVRSYLETFGGEQVKVCLFEDLDADSGAVCREIFEFLGVSDYPINTSKRFNPGGPTRSRLLAHVLAPQFPVRPAVRALFPGFSRRLKYRLLKLNVKHPPSMAPRTHAHLVDVFSEDVQRLAELVDRDLSHWLDPSATPVGAAR